MPRHSGHGQSFGPAYEVSIVKAKENGEGKRSAELKAGLPHSLSLGTSQLKAHNFMAKGSQKASNSPFLLAVVCQRLCSSTVTSTMWWRMKEFGAEAERMKGSLKHQDSWGEGRASQQNREGRGAIDKKEVCLEQWTPNFPGWRKIPPSCKGRRGNLSMLKTKNILKATFVYYRNGDKWKWSP